MNLTQIIDQTKTKTEKEFWKYCSFKELLNSGNSTSYSAESSVSYADGVLTILLGKKTNNKPDLPAGFKLSEVKKSIAPLESVFVSNSFAKHSLDARASTLTLAVPDNNQLDIKVDLAESGDGSALTSYGLNIVIGKNCTVNLSYIATKTKSGISNFQAQVSIGANSRLKAFFLERKVRSPILNHWQFDVARDAQVTFFDANLQTKWSRHNSLFRLCGEGAGVDLTGLYVATDDDFIDHHLRVEHLVPHTESKQVYKGILSGNAKVVFNGQVFIEKQAQKSNSSQLNKNLMLSKFCEVNTKPELQIFADDVKASHGATIGALRDEEVFYLKSRCISEQTARFLLKKAFVQELVDKVVLDVDKESLQDCLNESLEGLS